MGVSDLMLSSLVRSSLTAVPSSRSLWLVLPDVAESRGIEAALQGCGWTVSAVVHTVRDAGALLMMRAPPDVVMSALRLDDGDGLQVMRMLAVLASPPAIFVVSRQQRAVIKSALALASELGLPVAGFSEQPSDAAGVADRLASYVAPAPVRRPVDARPLERLELIDLLDRDALRPWFQPKIRLASREVVGFEALMRAHDAQGRLILPDRLVGALGEHGLLDRATVVMAERTVDFVAARLQEGMAISASLNLSMSSLSSMDLCKSLERSVARAGLDPSWIGIEITETDAMSDVTTVIENTTRIRMLGFSLSIDDFGTAYSSFLQLSRIPFSELKIERAFVTDLASDTAKRAIVSACAQLGASLGLHVVAEGVETVEELAAVQRLGCTQAQGYLLARPMPADEACDWLHGLQDLQVPF